MENHNRQGTLELSKKLVTHDGNFRMCTEISAKTLNDVNRLGQHHGITSKGKFE